jgi:hypothetical protein
LREFVAKCKQLAFRVTSPGGGEQIGESVIKLRRLRLGHARPRHREPHPLRRAPTPAQPLHRHTSLIYLLGAATPASQDGGSIKGVGIDLADMTAPAFDWDQDRFPVSRVSHARVYRARAPAPQRLANEIWACLRPFLPRYSSEGGGGGPYAEHQILTGAPSKNRGLLTYTAPA